MLNKNIMKRTYLITLIAAAATLWTACNSGDIHRNPGRVYAPDMTYSRAYDAYTTNPVTANGLTSQLSVPGTIARGHELPDHLKEEDTSAYYALPYPYQLNAAEIEEGGRLFNIYCGICHGEKLDGNGPLYASGKFAAMPANLVGGGAMYLHMQPGRIYHAIKYGKNMMGSYSSQLNEKQRWQVIAYVKKFQSENGGDPFNMGKETTDTVKTIVAGNTADSVKMRESH